MGVSETIIKSVFPKTHAKNRSRVRKAERRTKRTIRKSNKIIKEAKELITKAQDEVRIYESMMPLHQRAEHRGPTRLPFTSLAKRDIEVIAYQSSVLARIRIALTGAVFRRGIEINPAFVVKCGGCGKEFDYTTEQCDECKGTTMIEPDPANKLFLEKWIKKVNENGQSLVAVSKQTSNDEYNFDDGFMLMEKEYTISGGTIAKSVPKELRRVSPLSIDFVHDDKNRMGRNDQGDPIYTCVNHRHMVTQERICPHCQTETFRAVFKARQDSFDVYYIPGEIWHESEFFPSETNGFSPIVMLWNEIHIILFQNDYMMRYYSPEHGPPKGLTVASVDNPEGFQESWDEFLRRHHANPHEQQVLGIRTDKQNPLQFINFMNSLAEMEYSEGRQEIMNGISSLYGVLPIFTGDVSTSGGLNNEGLQVTVTNRAVERGQKIYNEGFYLWVTAAFGITDWKIELLPTEEKDEMAEKQRKQLDIQNAQLMQQMGFKVNVNEEGEFEFSDTPEDYVSPAERQEQMESKMADIEGGEQRFGGEPDKPIRKASLKIKPQKKFPKDMEKFFADTLKKALSNIDFKRPPRKGSLMSKTMEILNLMTERLKRGTGKTLKKIYLEEHDKVEKMANVNIKLGDQDTQILEVLSEGDVFRNAYAGMTSAMAKKVADTLVKLYEQPKGFSIDQAVRELKKELKTTSKARLERIARTETHNVTLIARENAYKKLEGFDKMKFKWSSIPDARRTDICKKISARTKKGVSMERLKEIIKEEADRKTYDPSRPHQPHIQCRSSAVRVR